MRGGCGADPSDFRFSIFDLDLDLGWQVAGGRWQGLRVDQDQSKIQNPKSKIEAHLIRAILDFRFSIFDLDLGWQVAGDRWQGLMVDQDQSNIQNPKLKRTYRLPPNT
jgi:hypothetical protein